MIGRRRPSRQTRRIEDPKLLTLLALLKTRSKLRIILFLE